MIETIVALGAWNWMILAAILFVLELLAPGIFLMWFGAAAAVTGLIVFMFLCGSIQLAGVVDRCLNFAEPEPEEHGHGHGHDHDGGHGNGHAAEHAH